MESWPHSGAQGRDRSLPVSRWVYATLVVYSCLDGEFRLVEIESLHNLAHGVTLRVSRRSLWRARDQRAVIGVPSTGGPHQRTRIRCSCRLTMSERHCASRVFLHRHEHKCMIRR